MTCITLFLTDWGRAVWHVAIPCLLCVTCVTCVTCMALLLTDWGRAVQYVAIPGLLCVTCCDLYDLCDLYYPLVDRLGPYRAARGGTWPAVCDLL